MKILKKKLVKIMKRKMLKSKNKQNKMLKKINQKRLRRGWSRSKFIKKNSKLMAFSKLNWIRLNKM